MLLRYEVAMKQKKANISNYADIGLFLYLRADYYFTYRFWYAIWNKGIKTQSTRFVAIHRKRDASYFAF